MGRSDVKFALKYFVAGSLFLSAGVLLLAFQTESFTLSGIISKLATYLRHNPYCGLVHHHGRYNSIRYLSFSSLVCFRYDFTNAGFSIDACRFCKQFRILLPYSPPFYLPRIR
jgi:hypothetical protein